MPTKAEADKIRAEVTPENFAQLARENSTDTTTKDKGGELGALVKGQFVPEFDKAAFALKDGEISQPVKTQFGWHIITVQTTPAHTTSFAEAKAGIIASQLAQKRQQAFVDWSQGVLKKWDARTVYADTSLKPPAAPTTAPTADHDGAHRHHAVESRAWFGSSASGREPPTRCPRRPWPPSRPRLGCWRPRSPRSCSRPFR